MTLKTGHRIAIDYGEKWFGLAITDALGLVASPVGTYEKEELITKLREISSEGEIAVIYFGLPLHLSGKEGASAGAARRAAMAIQELGIAPVRLVDERLSTKSATEDESMVKRYGIDAMAAVEILRFALEGERIQNRFFGSNIDD